VTSFFLLFATKVEEVVVLAEAAMQALQHQNNFWTPVLPGHVWIFLDGCLVINNHKQLCGCG
jgi:hypothetical protein